MWEDEIRVIDDQKGGAENGRSLQNSWGIHSMNEMALRPTAMGVSCQSLQGISYRFAERQGVPYQTLETESKKMCQE